MSGLLSRWQQRREQVAKEQEEVLQQATENNAAEVETQAEDAVETAEIQAVDNVETKVLTAEDLPDPESIEVGGSFASFMADNVDPAAKQAALKALWKQPQYNEIDGLLEYALDYSNQPKLSAEVSAEIAKKIFRHVVKDEPEDEEEQDIATAQVDDLNEAEAMPELEQLQNDNVVADNDQHSMQQAVSEMHPQANDEAQETRA